MFSTYFIVFSNYKDSYTDVMILTAYIQFTRTLAFKYKHVQIAI